MKLTKRKKPKNRRNKTFILSLALLMCMSLFIFPMTAYAANENANIAPPTVEAEIIGSLLRIRATSGYYAVEAVYVNEKRFNHRVDSALVIDISGYIAAGDTISVHAVDFAGNYSNTVLLSPPVPAQPPAPNNITPDGHGELLDNLSNSDNVEFITIETPAGSIFYLIIDHTRSSNNVYFLNPVTEWDLLTLAAAAELPVPDYIHQPQPTAEPVVVEKDPPTTETPTPEPTQESVEDDNSGKGGMYIFLAIAGVAAFGVIYYLKILKPKKEREMYGGGEDGEQEDADAFEDVDDSEEIINSEEPGESDDLSDGYNVDDGEYYKEGDESK
jgi:hypothetical protein